MKDDDKKTILIVDVETRNETKKAATMNGEFLKDYTKRVLAAENKKILKRAAR